MDSPQAPKRLNIWMPLLFSVILIVGMIIGFRLNETLRSKRPLMTIIERNDRLEEIIDLISDRYVDSIAIDLLYQDAIQGILFHLDPHTSYIPAAEFSNVRESMEGNFKGIGIEYYINLDTIQVVSVLSGGPSEHAGIMPGDKLIKVDDSLVAGVQIGNQEIIKHLRGEEGSKVKLSLLRPSSTQEGLYEVNISRGVIPIYSIDAGYMLDEQTGYIKINRFSATTYNEFVEKLDSLKLEGMQQLVLDLRQNPGGYLEAATDIADELIEGQNILVYTHGRNSPKKDYKAGRPGKFEHGKLVILVDEGSASASEIIAGTVQDWDRGILIGRETFGKGLVQEEYKLSDGAALRLTTSRYYTPTGRSIQRPYEMGKEAYQRAAEARKTGTAGFQQIDSNTIPLPQNDPELPERKYYTFNSKRLVLGGGGVRPDVEISPSINAYSENIWKVAAEIPAFVYDYYAHHKDDFTAYKNSKAFSENYQVKKTLLDEFKQTIHSLDVELAKQIWSKQNSADLKFVENRIKALLARMMFHSEGFYRITNQNDETVLKALEIINHDSTYSNIIMGEVDN